MVEPRRAPAALRTQERFHALHAKIHLASEFVAKFVQKPRELSLQIARQYRMRNRPRDDRKMLRPHSLRDEPSIRLRECLEPSPDRFAIAEPVPSRDLLLERLPVF